jgi:hypothetical protein
MKAAIYIKTCTVFQENAAGGVQVGQVHQALTGKLDQTAQNPIAAHASAGREAGNGILGFHSKHQLRHTEDLSLAFIVAELRTP